MGGGGGQLSGHSGTGALAMRSRQARVLAADACKRQTAVLGMAARQAYPGDAGAKSRRHKYTRCAGGRAGTQHLQKVWALLTGQEVGLAPLCSPGLPNKARISGLMRLAGSAPAMPNALVDAHMSQ